VPSTSPASAVVTNAPEKISAEAPIIRIDLQVMLLVLSRGAAGDRKTTGVTLLFK
jgi:hypothetical protein